MTGLITSTVFHDEVELSWDASTAGDLDHYNVFRDGMKVAEPATSFTDTGLEPETTYSYTVSAVDDEGNEGPQSSSDLATTDPEPEPGPLELDGTGGPTDEELKTSETYLTDAKNAITTFWTGWWPLLNILVYQEVQHPQTTLIVELHQKKNLLGFTEYSACSIQGDASVLGPADEDAQWLAWNVENILTPILLMGILIAGGVLEWAIKCNPNPLVLAAAAFALTMQALLAIAVPSIVIGYMVDIGEETRASAGRYLLEIGFGWLSVAGPFLLAAALAQAAASTGLITALAEIFPKLAFLATILQYALIANIVVLCIGIALLIIASIWFFG